MKYLLTLFFLFPLGVLAIQSAHPALEPVRQFTAFATNILSSATPADKITAEEYRSLRITLEVMDAQTQYVEALLSRAGKHPSEAEALKRSVKPQLDTILRDVEKASAAFAGFPLKFDRARLHLSAASAKAAINTVLSQLSTDAH